MKNLLSYCRLVDPRISASDKDLPVLYKVRCCPRREFVKMSLVERYVLCNIKQCMLRMPLICKDDLGKKVVTSM